jgi:hypothetical protein
MTKRFERNFDEEQFVSFQDEVFEQPQPEPEAQPEPVVEPEPEVQPEPEPVVETGPQVNVKIIDFTTRDGKYLAFDESGNGYLIDADKLEFSSNYQPISQADLDNSERPYNWDEEIDRLLPSRERMRQTLWRRGLLRKEDIENRMARRALDKAFPNIS